MPSWKFQHNRQQHQKMSNGIAKVISSMSEKLALDPQNVKIPDTLPLIPVRDIVVFPYMVLPLFVGRDMSIKAI